jgi:outer membrane efflux protein
MSHGSINCLVSTHRGRGRRSRNRCAPPFLNLQQAAESLTSARVGLTAAQEALRIAVVRFQAGVGTQLEVVTAVQNLEAADDAVVQAAFQCNLALAQIDQASAAKSRSDRVAEEVLKCHSASRSRRTV